MTPKKSLIIKIIFWLLIIFCSISIIFFLWILSFEFYWNAFSILLVMLAGFFGSVIALKKAHDVNRHNFTNWCRKTKKDIQNLNRDSLKSKKFKNASYTAITLVIVIGFILYDYEVGNICLGKSVTIIGTDNDDVIYGTPSRDIIHGRGGNDEIHGLEGNDLICGGDGDDKNFGGDGDDEIYGFDGSDKIYGGNGDDRLSGSGSGSSDDDVEFIDGDDGDDYCFTGGGTRHEKINCEEEY